MGWSHSLIIILIGFPEHLFNLKLYKIGTMEDNETQTSLISLINKFQTLVKNNQQQQTNSQT